MVFFKNPKVHEDNKLFNLYLWYNYSVRNIHEFRVIDQTCEPVHTYSLVNLCVKSVNICLLPEMRRVKPYRLIPLASRL